MNNMLEPCQKLSIEQLEVGHILEHKITQEKFQIQEIIRKDMSLNFVFTGRAVKDRAIKKMFETTIEGKIKVF